MRTHITASRWAEYQQRLARAESAWGASRTPRAATAKSAAIAVEVVEKNNRLIVSVGGIKATLNCRRGLAIESLQFSDVWPTPLCGTVPHGTFDDIRYSPDWYTGNLVFEAPAQHKVTDLEPASDISWRNDGSGALIVVGVVQTPLGPVKKTLTFSGSDDSPFVGLDYEIDWPSRSIGSLRLGLVTLLPGAFDERTLYYRTHNGGRLPETFALFGASVDHGSSVSALVSAGYALGVTDGTLELGDARKRLTMEVDKTASAVVGMVEHRVVAGKTFCQMLFSAGEIDDTRKPAEGPQKPLKASFRIVARKNAK